LSLLLQAAAVAPWSPCLQGEKEEGKADTATENTETLQRNKMYPETVQDISVVLEGYKNKLIK